MTEAEKYLRYLLRSKNLGFKFRRQQPIGPYIVDFVCLEKKLIIEVGGGQHDENKQLDLARDKWLINKGYAVLRFWNNEIMENRGAVLEKIHKSITLPQPPPDFAWTKSRRAGLPSQPTREASAGTAREGKNLVNFVDRVLDVVSNIPRGRVATYGQIAALVHTPRAARMVGRVLRNLRANSKVPWQRVINSRGMISIENLSVPKSGQAERLQKEGIKVIFKDGNYWVDLKKYLWSR